MQRHGRTVSGRVRHSRLWLSFLALALALALAPTAAVAAPQVDWLRAGAGLAPAPASPQTDALASVFASGAPEPAPGEGLEAQIVAPGLSLERDPAALRLILDPRTDAASLAGRADGRTILAVHRQTAVPFPSGLLIAYPTRWDPSSDRPLVVLSAAGSDLGAARLTDSLGRTFNGRGGFVGVADGMKTTVIQGGPGTQIPWGRHLQVLTDTGRAQITTTGAPATYRRPPTIRGGARAHAQLILSTLRNTPPLLAREILPRLGGGLVIEGARPRLCGGAGVSCYWERGQERTISLSRSVLGGDVEDRFILLHEFGHAVEASGLTEADREAFAQILHASRAYRCIPDPLRTDEPCLSDDEWFAEEFARWAIRDRRLSSGYGTPSAIAPARFERFLRTRFALHP